MMTPPSSPIPVPPSGGGDAPPPGVLEADDIGPSRIMEYWLFAIMAASLAVSISGLAFVYGFNLADPFSLTNVSPGVRGIIVDSIMFLGVYFTRRFLMHRNKRGWHWFWGVVWLLVAVIATSFSWFSNTLAVNELGTTVTQPLLDKAGFGDWDAATVNQVIAALPIVAILLYGIVPRRVKSAPRVVDTRTPDQILQEAQQEAARIHATRILRQARAEEVGEGLGDGISALTRGVNAALGRDPQAAHTAKVAREEALRQMRSLLIRHGVVTSLDRVMRMKPAQVQLLAETKQLWDAATNQPKPWALLPTEAEKRAALRKQALANGWLAPEEVAEEDEMGNAALEARYAALALRAEEARRQVEAQLPTQPADQDEDVAGDVVPPQLVPLAVINPGAGDGSQRTSKRDGFTPEELGKALVPPKSRATILNWMKEGATEPRKIYAHEVFTDSRGYQRILPEAYLRLKRVLEEETALSRGDSGPRKVVTKAAQNGAHHDEDVVTDVDEEDR